MKKLLVLLFLSSILNGCLHTLVNTEKPSNSPLELRGYWEPDSTFIRGSSGNLLPFTDRETLFDCVHTQFTEYRINYLNCSGEILQYIPYLCMQSSDSSGYYESDKLYNEVYYTIHRGGDSLTLVKRGMYNVDRVETYLKVKSKK